MDDLLRRKILDIIAEHRVMTVAKLRADGWPQATTVGYASDGLTLYFLCGLDSQKAANLARDNRVSITIDHDAPQVMEIAGLSMAGRAERVTDTREAQRAIDLLISRYPEQRSLPFQMPKPAEVCIMQVAPVVISVLDYSKGFGHTDLVLC
jgi:nitroimidazol reductase NimA-like FMN-containing flavoprotein (pyridoxamine 5'-phosphate oxidase superfamily)